MDIIIWNSRRSLSSIGINQSLQQVPVDIPSNGMKNDGMNQSLDEDIDHINGESRTDDSKNILHSAVHTKH